MWYVIRGDFEGLECVKCNSYDIAVIVMLQQIQNKIDIYGISGDSLEISRDRAYVLTNEGLFEWKIIEGRLRR